MGFFNKIFGDSEPVPNPDMISWENFFGVNLKSSPNELWDENDQEYNISNQLIRNFSNYSVDNTYFSSAKAKVIGNSATNFFFRCSYDETTARDIYFLIERDLVRGGNYEYKEAIRNFYGKFNSLYDHIDWEIDNCTINMSRDIDTGEITLGVWTLFYNKEFLDNTSILPSNNIEEVEDVDKTSDSKMLSSEYNDMLSWENFFGVNLKASPDESWDEHGQEYNPSNELIRNFSKNYIGNTYFSSVEAKVIGNSSTNFFYKCAYDETTARDIYFLIERDLVRGGDYQYTEAIGNFYGKFDSLYDDLSWHVDNCDIRMSRDLDNGDICLGIWTLFYNKAFLYKKPISETSSSDNKKDEESFGSDTMPSEKKMFKMHFKGDMDTLEFLRKDLQTRIDGGSPVYVVRPDGSIIHFLTEDYYSEVFSCNDEKVTAYLNGRLGAAVFSNFNLDDMDDIKVDLWVIPVHESQDTNNKEQNNDVKIHYEMDYLIDPVNYDYRRKTIMDGRVNFNIVGMKFRENYENLLNSLKVGMKIILKPEPTNEVDPNALAFYQDGKLIGYLSKKDQPFARTFLAKGFIETAISNIDIDENWVDTEVSVTKEMIDYDAADEFQVRFSKIESAKGGYRSIKTIDIKDFANTL